MRLTDKMHEGDHINIDGAEYALDLSFDNVLRIRELYEDEDVDDYRKIEFMFEMFFLDDMKLDLFIEKKVMIIENIFEHFIEDDAVKEKVESEHEQNGEPKESKKTYDINKDAEYIYASFLFDYNLDLFEQQGKLHWKKFVALLNGLSKESAFMQVVHIRTMEVPKADKHNQKERQRILKLKRLYALEKEDENADNAFEHMVSAFGGRPKAGD